MNKLFTLILTIVLVSNTVTAQLITQTIRGKVIDKESRLSLPSANVILTGTNPIIGTVTDPAGNFRLTGVPVGRQTIQVTFVGYKPATISNLIINSAKETVLEIELEENVVQSEGVTIKAYAKKDEMLNKMASVSARMFTVEETEKFAGSRGDVARMAMNYAGVSAANDSRNDIIIRGNSPTGLLWRLEDVEIPNPNHFAENGTTGGPVGMLNNNLLVNSDFLTGAFPSEYGNALSGVFDLKMRNGNNEKHEFLFQSGFNGFEAGAEGPLSKNHNNSYLVNFRYSTLELVDNFINLGTSGVPKYKDASFKLNFPLKNGKLTWFALAGTSEIAMLDSKQDEQDMYTSDGQDLRNRSRMITSGISYTHFVGERSYYKLSLSGFINDGGTIIDTLDAGRNPHLWIDHNFGNSKISLSGFYHTKYNAQFSTKTGFIVDKLGYKLLTSRYYSEDNGMRKLLDANKNSLDGPTLYRAYVEGTYKFSDKLSFNPGVHVLYFDLNNSYNIEPRLGMVWQISSRQKISAGYGLHSQIQALSTYYYGTHLADNTLVETNTNLGITKSNQFILGYETSLSENTRFKAESYYQYLFDVPVEKRSSSYSILNAGAGWGIGAEDSLVNSGTGVNYGLEFTLERFFSKNFYYLTTLSLFNSKYKGSDGVTRNTAFNGQYVINGLLGYELPLSKKSAFTFDFKLTYAGGKYYTPIDLEKSKTTGYAEYIDSEAFSKKFDPFVKADFKVGFRLNGKKVSQEWQFYIENFTNHKNVLIYDYSRSKEEITTIYQLGFFPMMLYRIHF